MSTAARRIDRTTYRCQVGGSQGRQPRLKTTVNGIEFSSKTEARFYGTLLELQRARIVAEIECHPVYVFQEKFTNGRGIKRRAHKYTGDFRVTFANGVERIYEVKAAPHMIPQDFKLRRDAVEAKFGVVIVTVYTSNGRWIDADTKEALEWT